MSKDEFKNISSNLMQIIDNLIEVNGYGFIDLFNADKNLQIKIDLLERTIEILRIEQKHLDNDYPMEEFLQGNLEFVGSKIKFTAPDKRKKWVAEQRQSGFNQNFYFICYTAITTAMSQSIISLNISLKLFGEVLIY